MVGGSVEDLLRAATVLVEGGPRPGAGFFVAPGRVLTCAHVVGAAPHERRIRWPAGDGMRTTARVQSVSLLCDGGQPIPALAEAYPDVAVLTVGLEDHPCVAIDDEWPRYGDTFQTYGFPHEGGSVLLTPAALSYRGKKASEPTVFIDLASDTVKPGLSGGALLNLRSNAVCGIVVATRSPASPDGGLAVPWSALRDRLGDLIEANREFHLADRRWALAAGRARRRMRFNLPRVAAHFSGRRSALSTLRSELAARDRAVVVQAVSGLGGVGKTQLVARFVELHADDYDIVAWIGAESGGVTDLAELAAALDLPVAEPTPEARAGQVVRWLEQCDESWLLVLDNLQSPEQLPGCCPARGCGRVVVTSRDRSLEQFGPMLSLDAFDVDTAADYLVARARRPQERGAARRLAEALGGLPLALSHAAAYCLAGTRFDDYLELLADLPAREVFDSTPDVFYEQTVAATWQVSMRAAGAVAPLSLPVLEMAGYMAPNAIPRSLFAVLVRGGGVLERKRLIDACKALHRFSLADLSDDALSVHRLVQKIVRDDADARHDPTGARHAVRALTDGFPRDLGLPPAWPRCERLVLHILALAEHMTSPGRDAVELVGLLHEACTYRLYAIDDTRALETARVALDAAMAHLGRDHVDTLTAQSNLAFAHRRAGHTAAAVALSEEAVRGFERVRGRDHRHTFLARQNLAQAYEQAGRMADAIALLERLVADWERRFGSDEPGRLGARGALSEAYGEFGRTAEAIAIDRQDVVDVERLHGADDYSAVSARHRLAVSLLHAGRLDEATSLLEGVLEDTLRLLGRDHDTLIGIRAHLASAYHLAGRAAEAIARTEEVLRDREGLLGALHPQTLLTRQNLAVIYDEAGRTVDAIALAERVLADRLRLFGSDDPQTLLARANVAAFYRRAGRTADAIATGEAVLADQRRVLGGEHPKTLRTMDNLALAYHQAGRLADALALGEATAGAAERCLGAEHPYAARAKRNLRDFRDSASEAER